MSIKAIKGIKEESIRLDGRLLATFFREKKLVCFCGSAKCLNKEDMEQLTNWLIYIQDQII